MSAIHTTALAAWTDLRSRGGIEPGGRDEGLEERLRERLSPSAPSLAQALDQATTEEFVSAFFDVLLPYVSMFRAILEFFKQAGAAEGREQWNIVFDDVDLDLDHFRRFLKKWHEVPCELEVPAIDADGAWAMLGATSNVAELSVERDSPTGLPDVDDWLRRYAPLLDARSLEHVCVLDSG